MNELIQLIAELQALLAAEGSSQSRSDVGDRVHVELIRHEPQENHE